jgi:beta-mannosidase
MDMPFPRIALPWTVGPTPRPDRAPEHFIPAAVPGAVQLDWAAAQGWPAIEYQADYRVRYEYEDHGAAIAADYEWMEDQHWLYRAVLPAFDLAAGQRLYFTACVDYRCEVRLNGQTLAAREGFYTPLELDLTGIARPGDTLEVLIFPAPKLYASPVDAKQATQSCKPAFNYGWDYLVRLIPLGIWDGGCLELRPACHIRRAETRYELSDDFSRADVRLEVALSGEPRGRLRWTLADPRGRLVLEREAAPGGELAGVLASPELWWPNGQGPQSLYTSTVELLDESGTRLAQHVTRVGFRRVRLVPFEGSWEDPEVWGPPTSQHKPPITLEVNGRRIFAKGSNWVGPDIFPARVDAERHRALLQAAREANFNILRCWGGAPVQKDSFFDLCDELGLMIWQEFPLACGRYEATPAYMRLLDEESRAIIQRLRSRACVVLWCGGNELFNAWSQMTEQDLALRLLDRNTFELDPSRPFIKTSPLMGWAHGGYQFRLKDGREVYQYFAQTRHTAYTEFGVPGPASVETLRRILPAGELFPPVAESHWRARHGFRGWDGSRPSWLELWCIEHYFGPSASLEELVARAHWLQSEGYKFIFEEARRQKPRCSMALNWCFNEPWPAAANNSLLGWPAEPKPALHAVGESLRPALASARVPHFAWQPGETFCAELFLLNDAPESLPAGRIEAALHAGSLRLPLGAWDHPAAAANTNLAGPILETPLPGDLPPGPLRLTLTCAGQRALDSEYVLLALAPRPAQEG